MNVLTWLLKGSVSALPGAALLWVNKLVALFEHSPRVAYRGWRVDADSTAAAFGTGLVIVLAIGASSIPKRIWRAVLGALFLIICAVCLWQCYTHFTKLNTIAMPAEEAQQLQAIWEYWYIGMLCSFVAAITSAMTSLWSERQTDGDTGNRDEADPNSARHGW